VGRLAFAQTGLENAYLDRWPVFYVADFSSNTGIWAANGTELADGLHHLLDGLDREVAELEPGIN
jgi:hypothetical protein